MEFKNDCNSYFIKEDLEKAIKEKVHNSKHKLKDEYRLVLRNGYPTVCIGHDRYYVHRLLAELYFGNCEVVHHIDHNRLNNLKNNLEPMTFSQHAFHHHKGKDFRSDDSIKASITAMAIKRKRQDVTTERVKELRESGMTIEQISKELHCGVNTVSRRLGMKDY